MCTTNHRNSWKTRIVVNDRDKYVILKVAIIARNNRHSMEPDFLHVQLLSRQQPFTRTKLQGSAKRLWLGLVNGVAAVAYQFCRSLPAAFTQPGQSLLVHPCTGDSAFLGGRNVQPAAFKGENVYRKFLLICCHESRSFG